MKAITRSHLEQIERKYNPDFDIPERPQVPWATYYLLEAIYDLFSAIEKLEAKIEALENSQPQQKNRPEREL